MNADCYPIVEFVAETGDRNPNDKVKYIGAVLAKISDTCTLETMLTGEVRNWIIRHLIKYLVNKRKYKKLKKKPEIFFRDSKSKFIQYLGRYYMRGNSTIVFYWRKQFKEYFDSHDMERKVEDLKKGMDDISARYIDHFMKLSKFWFKSTYIGNQWTEYDIKKKNGCIEFSKTLEQPFPEILKINPYYYYDIYGLADLPKEVLSSIDGKTIIDGGGLNGDTALVFHRHFPNSEIHVYEPLERFVDIIYRFLAVDCCNNKIIPINKGLGDKVTRTFIMGYNIADITTVDSEYQNTDKQIGLIKLDTEGMETNIIKGAEKVIARDKPVLAIAIYHRPEDFFELKDKVKAMNSKYRFMIRKSEPSLPQADLVLIAY